jgi:hypothetical protein
MLRSLLRWLRLTRSVQVGDFSLRIESVTRECVAVVYQEGERVWRFGGELMGSRWQDINVAVPKDLADADTRRIVANLARGLADLGYGYEIVRWGEPVPEPDAERAAAQAELRNMGIAVEVAPDGRAVRSSPLPGWRRPSREEAQETAPHMLKLIIDVAGSRRPAEILATSLAADGERKR